MVVYKPEGWVGLWVCVCVCVRGGGLILTQRKNVCVQSTWGQRTLMILPQDSSLLWLLNCWYHHKKNHWEPSALFTQADRFGNQTQKQNILFRHLRVIGMETLQSHDSLFQSTWIYLLFSYPPGSQHMMHNMCCPVHVVQLLEPLLFLCIWFVSIDLNLGWLGSVPDISDQN